MQRVGGSWPRIWPICLGDPDPAIRDGIAFEALAHWMRAGDLDADALRDMRERLLAMLAFLNTLYVEAGSDANIKRMPGVVATLRAMP